MLGDEPLVQSDHHCKQFIRCKGGTHHRCPAGVKKSSQRSSEVATAVPASSRRPDLNRIYCWGTDAGLGSGSCNVNGALEGPIRANQRNNPSDQRGAQRSCTPVAADLPGHGFACALLADGSVYCWGDPTNAAVSSPQ